MSKATAHAKERPGNDLRSAVARRLREREFWYTQAAIAVTTILHVVIEAGGSDLISGHDAASLHHFPVVLYLLPVAYASLVYGWEGALLTGAWAGVLAMSTVPFWHADHYDWVFELAFVVVVMGVGAVMARPVELERDQRRKAERSARRLAILNELGPGAAIDGPAMAGTVATRVAGELDAESVRVTLRYRSTGDIVADARVPTSAVHGEKVAEVVSVGARLMDGDAEIVLPAGSSLIESDKQFVESVLEQFSVRVENALLADRERAVMVEYVRLVTEAQERERKRISRDLHDGPAQDLALLVRELDERGAAEPASSLRRRASAILEQVRRTARRQRPSALDILGLRAALESTIDDQASAEVSVSFATSGPDRRLPPEVEESLYRIAQEAVRNAVAHSGGHHVAVRLEFENETARVVISDDGAGFEPPDEANALVMAGHLGIMGMTERAELIGASFSVQSSSEGTTVAVCWRNGDPDAPSGL